MISRIFRMAAAAFLAFTLGVGIGSLIRDAFADPSPIETLRSTAVRISNGSGSIVEGSSGRHYLLTNYHVCMGAAWKGTLTAFFPDGETVTGRITKRSPAIDLCAARLFSRGPALKIGRQLAPMQDIWTRGYPNGILSETHGHVGQEHSWTTFFPIDMIGECPPEYKKEYSYEGPLAGCRVTFTSTLSTLYSRPGSSGSAVVDENGGLVGVVSSFDPNGAYNAGMVSFDDVKAFMEAL
jgi:S1-C subfamily serine protease